MPVGLGRDLRHYLAGEPIEEVELWDLVSAFSRIMREAQGGPKTKIQYDDVPIHIHAGGNFREFLQILSTHRKPVVEYLAETGILGPRTTIE